MIVEESKKTTIGKSARRWNLGVPRAFILEECLKPKTDNWLAFQIFAQKLKLLNERMWSRSFDVHSSDEAVSIRWSGTLDPGITASAEDIRLSMEKLVKQRLIAKKEENGKTVYSTTDKGRAFLEETGRREFDGMARIKEIDKGTEPVYGLIYGNKTGNDYSLQVRIPKIVRDLAGINEKTPLLVRFSSESGRKRVILEVVEDEKTLAQFSALVKAQRKERGH